MFLFPVGPLSHRLHPRCDTQLLSASPPTPSPSLSVCLASFLFPPARLSPCHCYLGCRPINCLPSFLSVSSPSVLFHPPPPPPPPSTSSACVCRLSSLLWLPALSLSLSLFLTVKPATALTAAAAAAAEPVAHSSQFSATAKAAVSPRVRARVLVRSCLRVFPARVSASVFRLLCKARLYRNTRS